LITNDYNIIMDLEKPVLLQRKTFVQNDTKSCKIVIEFKRNAQVVDLTGLTVNFAFQRADGISINAIGTITDAQSGVCEYVLASNILAVEGQVLMQVSLFGPENERLTSVIQVPFTVIADITDGANPIAEADDYPVLTQLITDCTAILNAEATRVIAEQDRVEAEVLRLSAENARVASEATRVIAEQDRVEAEVLRLSAENARVASEASRGSAETTRQTNESARISAEASRVTSESARVSEFDTIKTEYANLSSQIIKKYGVRRTLGATTPNLERLYSAVGKVANFPVGDVSVQNDFDSIYPWSHMRDCIRDSTGRFHYKGDPAYGAAIGDHLVEIPKFYASISQTETYRDFVLSEYPAAGLRLPYAFYREDGTICDKIYVAKYKTCSDGGVDVSRPDLVPENYRDLASFRIGARAKGAGWQLIDIAYVSEVLHVLYLIEYASLYSQDKLGLGVTAMRYASGDTAQIAETGVNRIVVLNAVADNFAVGQQISIGTSLGSSNVANKRNITAINAVDASTKEIVFDGATVNIAVGNIVWSSAQKTGSTKNLTLPSGRLAGTNGKVSMKYRDIEDPFGNVLEWVDGLLINNNIAHICRKPSLYASTLTTDYKAVSYTNKNTDGYPLEMGYDNNYPEALFPITTGAGSTTGYTDYYYQNTGLRGAFFGGYTSNGSAAGLFYWGLGNTPSAANWSIGSRLLFKPPVG